MKALLEFIYTGRIKVKISEIVSMIGLVDYYDIKGARTEFEKAALHFIAHADC